MWIHSIPAANRVLLIGRKKNYNVIAYKGIPFVGKQPGGELRWKAPVDFVPDVGIYEAYYYGKSPFQADGDPCSLYVMGEDCLYLNVWKAAGDSLSPQSTKKPVMVWIYGGGFETGGTVDPKYDCTNFITENPDVIVVTIAYRLAAEGWNMWANDRVEKKSKLMTDEENALVENYLNSVPGEDWEKATSLFTQSYFHVPAIRLSEYQTKAGGKVYTYLFTPEASVPMLKSGHAIEQSAVFGHPELIDLSGRAFDATFTKTMRKLWVQFAKTGNPSLSADISPDGKAKEWPLYDLKDKQVMVLDEFDIHPAKESDVKIVDWERTYFLTKYYML